LGQRRARCFDKTESLQMAMEVKELDENKFFKIAKLNLKSKA
jgi:hypothetical protein